MSDGTVFGTLCAFSSTPDLSLDDAAVTTLRCSAVVVGMLLEASHIDRRAAVVVRSRIDRVLDSGGPRMHFQPIVAVPGGEILGYEALARFPDDRAPDIWFAEAWDVGRGVALEMSAVAAAMRDFPVLDCEGFLTVNLAATSCGEEQVLELLSSGPVDRLVVEITEHSAIDNAAALVAHLAPFRELGGRLAIDDVGIGFSGLTQLVELAPDVIKLDRSLVAGLPDDSPRAALVAAMVAYSGSVGSWLLAEGVEDERTALALQDLGVRFAQGYHFGRPQPTAAGAS
ncbi:MAG: EAL domain-containing protein [Actinobacteria bacterium]|nr:EAL domain-containing protein [Actinomycetota bacterium]